MGPEKAAIVMSMFPPAGWGDVATKQDLQMLKLELRTDMSTQLSDLLRTLFFAMIVSNATLVGLVFAAVRLG